MIKTLVPVGMTGLKKNNQSVTGRSFESVPVTVRNYFGLEKKILKPLAVSFSVKSIYQVLLAIDIY